MERTATPRPEKKAAPKAKQAPKAQTAPKAKQAEKTTKQANARAGKKRKAPAKAKTTGRYIALKANLPLSALSVHNLDLEVAVHKHISIDFPVMWSISDVEPEHAVRGIAFQPEGRWWLKGVNEGGHFFGVHAHTAWGNLRWDDRRYQTEKRPLLGAGISYGYRLPLGRHWGAEANLGFGYANVKYNTYYNIENGALIDRRIRHYWGLTRAGLSLVYRF